MDKLQNKAGIQAIKSAETRHEWYYSIALWENPYFGIEQNIWYKNAKVLIFSQSYAVILSFISCSSIFYNFLIY